MELALSLGNRGVEDQSNSMGFCMGLGLKGSSNSSPAPPSPPKNSPERREKMGTSSASPPRLQLDLLPFSPVHRPSQPPHPAPLRFPWLADNLSSEPGSSDVPGSRTMREAVGVTVAAEEVEEQSSPNSETSSFLEFSMYNGNNGNNYGQEIEVGVGVVVGGDQWTTTSRGSDDEENGSTRKKLRLSKEQSAFLEESFKEHHTLNPKQKLALAKQLNLRPRQVEVWFQNRRARTKLKQTEVDCEYLKRCCETLTEENKRLQKELQELRALKSSQPFFMQLPATTLTMCPSCERVAPTSSSAPASATLASANAAASPSGTAARPTSVALSLGKPKPMLPFSQAQAQIQAHAKANQAAS